MTISIVIAGNVGRDAEVRHTTKGDSVVTWSVASNQGKGKDPVFLKCSLWGKRAESALPSYIVKGTPMTVIGTLAQQKYKDKQTGEEKTSFEIKVQEIVLQGSKRQEEAPRQEPKAAPHGGKGTFDEMDDDIPF